jgi:hypothetical protein
MRACARVALASIAVSASFSLSGCAAIEELKETLLRWVESQKLASEGGVSAEHSEATPVVPPEKTPKESSGPHSRRMRRANRNARPLCFLQRNHRSRLRVRRLCFLQRNRRSPILSRR